MACDVLYIQPWDKPWLEPEIVAARRKMYLPRSLFEVGYQIPVSYSVSVLNLNPTLKSGQTLSDAVTGKLALDRPRIVLLTMPTFAQGDQLGEIVRLIRAQSPKSKIVLGGSAITLIKGSPLQWWDVDCCYDGFGTEVPALLQALDRNEEETIPGVLWRSRMPRCPRGASQLLNGYMASDLYTLRGRVPIEVSIEEMRNVGIEPMGILEMARGCSFRCSFCAINGERMGFFTRAPEAVLAEARFLLERGVTYLHLIDPTFGLDRRGTPELLDGLRTLAEEYQNMHVEILTRAELVTEELAQSCRLAHIVRVGIGMESMDASSLESVQKTLKPERTRSAALRLAAEGIETKFFHIAFPGKISEVTIRFLLDLTRDKVPFVIQTSFLRKLPGPDSPPRFLDQDQTTFVPTEDTPEQLVEWILVNLAFRSMDVGTGGDPALTTSIAQTLKRGKPLTSLLKWKKGGKELWVSGGSRSYAVVPRSYWPLGAAVFEAA